MWTSLVAILVVTAISGAALALGARPRLGLDLQGGISAVYTPVFDTDADLDDVEVEETLDQTIEVIRTRIDSLGVAEPEISRLGTDINVQLPGVADADRANEIIGRTAQLAFYPVEELLVPGLPGYTETEPCITEETAGDGTTRWVLNPDRPQPDLREGGVVCGPLQVADTAGDASEQPTEDGATPAPSESIGPADPATPAESATPGETATPAATETTTESASAGATGSPVAVSAAQETVSEAPAPAATPTPAPSGEATDGASAQPSELPTEVQTIDPEDIDDGLPIDAPRPVKYRVGPAPTSPPDDADGDPLTGDDIEDATAALLGQEFGVSLSFDDDGSEAFQAATSDAACDRDQGGPGQLAIVLDDVVESAPTMQTGVLCGQGIADNASITTGDQEGAEDLALVLRAGALPVTLEPATFETVSPTLGASSLRNGLIAGLVGLLLVGLYLLYFYRALGAIAIGALVVFGLLVMGTITLMGRFGFALTLAGVAGIIVSVGITADSSIIYFERIRDEVAVGKTIRLAVSRGFTAAFSTNLAGNTVTMVAAVILYFLAVGPVRGFAFTLGLATLLDLVIMWAFTRSVVGLSAFRGKLGKSIRQRQAAGAPQPSARPSTDAGGAA
nr:protein translocase subunit SecD [Salsipaludibacter albus]